MQNVKEWYDWWKEKVLKVDVFEEKNFLTQTIKDINKGILDDYFELIKEDTNYLPEDISVKERLYHLVYELNEPANKCKYCGGKVKLISFYQGYQKYCSQKCSFKDQDYWDKVQNTNMERYGSKYAAQNEEVSKKLSESLKETFKDKEKKEEILSKRKKTYQEKTGYQHQMHNPEVVEKVREATTGKPKKVKPEQLMVPDDDNLIQCELCGKVLKMITSQHLEKCSGIDLDEYKRRFPNSKIIANSLKKYRVENCQKLNDTYREVTCEKCGEKFEVLQNSSKRYCDTCMEPERYYNQIYDEDNDLVICQLCWKGFEQITMTHCETDHGITIQDYKKKFPLAPTTNKKIIQQRYENGINRKLPEEAVEKIKRKNTKTAKDYQESYPWIFNQIEEIKEGENFGEILARCKNHNCPNSKEKGGWFVVSKSDLFERIRSLMNNEPGREASFLYCSDECKKECPMYGKTIDQLMNHTEVKNRNLSKEYYIWREEVLSRDNYECAGCGNKENLEVHHIIPVKQNDFFIFDPENGITLCRECHNKIGHKDEECGYNYLAKLKC